MPDSAAYVDPRTFATVDADKHGLIVNDIAKSLRFPVLSESSYPAALT